MSKSDVTPSSMGRPNVPTPGPERIKLADLSGPRKDQPIVELRFVNPNGDTEVWMLPTLALPWEDSDFRGAVRLAYLDRGVDSRLATQRGSIDRLQSHVDFHHDGLAGVFPCGFQEKS